MFSNPSHANSDTKINYPIYDSSLPFAEYIIRTRKLLEERRELENGIKNKTLAEVIEANCPFESYPEKPILSGDKLKYGALLIHGLLDSPFTYREISHHLQQNGILSRTILLPGHGTRPSDLLNVSYQDWIQAVRYGIETFRGEVQKLFLVGYSTGAILAVYQALQEINLGGIILLSPAIRIRAPVTAILDWNEWWRLDTSQKWFYVEDEIDYTKYRSICYNAAAQVAKFTDIIEELRLEHLLAPPILMILSREDETISSQRALEYFSSVKNDENKCLLYSAKKVNFSDPRIQLRNSVYPELNIKDLSHICLPFSKDNPHYGQQGDFIYASRPKADCYYGSYNRLQIRILNKIKRLGLLRYFRKELTYNPDFDFMMDQIVHFILDK